jgi:hypothetical protein
VPVNEWDAQIEAGPIGQGKSRRKAVTIKIEGQFYE